MSNKLVHAHYRITLKPLTPIHVWNGIDIVFGIDAIYKNKHLCIIDYETLPIEFIKEAVSVSPNQLPQVISKYKNILPCMFCVNSKIKLTSNVKIKLIDKNIVPGSSLKGYIRTAIMYYLASDLASRLGNQIESALRSGINLFVEPKRVSEGLEGKFFRKPRLRSQGGFVDFMQRFLVSDPIEFSDKIILSVDELQVYKLPQQGQFEMNKIASVYAIVFSSGELKYDAKIIKTLNIHDIVGRRGEHNNIISKLLELDRIDLLEALNIFGCDLVKSEINRLKQINKLKYYVDLLNKYYDKYCKEKSECVIARLGFMTGHQAKTILSLVKKVAPKLYTDITSYLTMHYHHPWDELTVKLVKFEQDLVGIGWCELCLEQI